MSTQNQLTNEGDNLVEAFAQAYRDAAKSLTETGRLLVEIVDGLPNGLERLQKRIPGLSSHTVKWLLAVGRGLVIEGLLLTEGPGVTRLRECDISLQQKYSKEPLQVLIFENGRTTHLLASIFDLAPEQAKQVFGRGFVRSLEQQRQWIESQKGKPKNIAIDRPYSVKRGKIVFHQPCEMTIQQLSLLLAEAAA